MDRIDKYKRVKEDQQQGKGKVKVIPQGRTDFRSDRFNVVRPRKDHVGPIGSTNTQVVNVVFREPVYRVLEKIKNKPFFKWPNKMAGNPTRRNPSLYCQYHQEQGHTTEECRNLWDHLKQLVQEGKLKELLHHSNSRMEQTGLDPQKDTPSGSSLKLLVPVFSRVVGYLGP